jgi:hypothetical protein
VPLNGYPLWRERTVLALTNAVRMSPGDYKLSAVYAVGTPTLNLGTVLSTTYPSRPPFFWQYDLNRSSRQHSVEMATYSYFAHTSVDGGSPASRILSYYTLSGTYGENIAAGNLDPIATMHQWLCDQATSASPCCDDGASCDGHRRNIMSPSLKAMGVGYGALPTSTYRYYWTQDFGGVATAPFPPLADGTHLLSTSQTRFIANVSTTAAVRAVTLVLEGQQLPLAVELGNTTRGTWFVTTARGTTCRPYYFVTTDSNGVLWRYPAQGQLQTTGEGTCAQEWTP